MDQLDGEAEETPHIVWQPRARVRAQRSRRTQGDFRLRVRSVEALFQVSWIVAYIAFLSLVFLL